MSESYTFNSPLPEVPVSIVTPADVLRPGAWLIEMSAKRCDCAKCDILPITRRAWVPYYHLYVDPPGGPTALAKYPEAEQQDLGWTEPFRHPQAVEALRGLLMRLWMRLV
jgi:hypothetical protein